jgi:deoxyribonuclease-4
MSSSKTLIGRHISISQGFLTAPSFAKKLGCNCFQIFLANPQQGKIKVKPEKELKDFAKELKEQDVYCVVHASYLINLCQKEGSKRNTSLDLLIKNLEMISIIGKRCIGTIIHMGKNITELNQTNEKAIVNYVDGLKEAIQKTPENSTIILETGAGQGTEVGTKLEELAEIYNGLSTSEKQRVKFCIDTCHIFAAGYCISSQKGVDKYFNKFDKLIGVENIVCIHFNDSKTDCDSHIDSHEDLSFGFIPVEGLEAVAKFAVKNHIPLIMETPLDAINPKTNQEITFEYELRKVKKWTSGV